jgi:hypothetical protein
LHLGHGVSHLNFALLVQSEQHCHSFVNLVFITELG